MRISQSFACGAARALPLGALLIASALAPLPASGQPVWARRVSAYEIGGWSDLTFAGATARYQILLHVDQGASTVGTLPDVSLETLRGARDHFWQGDGTYVSVANASVVSAGLMTADVTLAATDPTLDPGAFPGALRLGYVTDVVDAGPGAYSRSWITREVVGSRWALTFVGGGVGFIEGRRFDVVVDVAGDWTDPTRAELLGVNSGWSMDAATLLPGGVTRFHVSTRTYAGNTSAPGGNPDLSLRFWGDAVAPSTVPEPGTLALTLGGLLSLAGFARRRRARPA